MLFTELGSRKVEAVLSTPRAISADDVREEDSPNSANNAKMHETAVWPPISAPMVGSSEIEGSWKEAPHTLEFHCLLLLMTKFSVQNIYSVRGISVWWLDAFRWFNNPQAKCPQVGLTGGLHRRAVSTLQKVADGPGIYKKISCMLESGVVEVSRDPRVELRIYLKPNECILIQLLCRVLEFSWDCDECNP